MASESGATTTERLREIELEARAELAATADTAALEQWRVRYLGRNGLLTGVLRSLGGLPNEQRRETGAAANALKRELESALEERETEQRRSLLTSRLESAAVDVTLPAARPNWPPASGDANAKGSDCGVRDDGFPGGRGARSRVGRL